MMRQKDLFDFAENVKGDVKSNEKAIQEWRSGTIQERLTHSLGERN